MLLPAIFFLLLIHAAFRVLALLSIFRVLVLPELGPHSVAETQLTPAVLGLQLEATLNQTYCANTYY